VSTLEISLTKGQIAFLQALERFPFFCAGYASGKSHLMGLKGSLDMGHSATAIVGFYEPYHDLIRQVAWPNVMKWLTELGVSYKLNKQDSVIYTSSSGYGDAIFKSMDNVEAMVGYETYRSHIDEIDTMSPINAEKAFFKIMGRNRQAPQDVPIEYRKWVEKTRRMECINTISSYCTPEGFKFCYKMWHPHGENAKNNPEFKLYKGRTMDNSTLTEDYIQSLKTTYPEKLLKAYMEGEFVNLESGSVYYNFDRNRHNTTRIIQPFNPDSPNNDVLKIGIDFNVMNTCGIVFVDDVIEGKERLSIVAEIVKQLDTPALIRCIKARWPQHEIICYPDNTGRNRSAANANPNANNIALLKEAGFDVRTKSVNPKIKNRVASVVKLLEDDKLFINVAECPEITRCFEQQCYTDKGEPDKSTGLDHPPDAAGYRIEQTHSIKKPLFQINSSFVQKR
jgi:hypothetical protein